MKEYRSFDGFCETIDTLLGENGCPWDRAQTHRSLAPNFLEECYEAVDAELNGDMKGLVEELGDVLLHVVISAKKAELMGEFTLEDVIAGISGKMKARHPHIFAGAPAATPEEALDNWDKMKREEKGSASHTENLREVPRALPSLMRAYKVIRLAQKSGLGPFEAPYASDMEAAIGAMLLNIVNISINLQINPEFALTNALEQFINRFEYVENASIPAK